MQLRKKEKAMALPKEVGFTHVSSKNPPEKIRFLRWEDVDYDEEGWALADKWLPHRYDIVMLKTNIYKNPMPGWWSGKGWDGRRAKKGMRVQKWKRISE